MNKVKIKSFTDLNTWKEGHKLVLLIYRVIESFPREEIFGLTIQMRRAAVSVTSNIARRILQKIIQRKSTVLLQSAKLAY